MDQVKAELEDLSLPTYGLGRPEKNPLFFEKRVYQGSCGKVYPLPFIDKVYQDDPPKSVSYKAARLENKHICLIMLPEIGGRIFLGQDRSNDDYDFFYRQDVIKPALVGLAGPWLSGGVEFNWPQHHRPGTYMPADVHIEEEPDGARTVWMSEHDPLDRLKGMHGIRLTPGSSLIELKGRLYNRTPITRTFLWWANVAARVHDNYQSFFPPDVHYVADHAVRAMSSFPVAMNDYYGVDYAGRPGANDLSWYKNIPVPTSYMVCETEFSFFGGYDYDKQGGFVHVADRHISPGKKQWTWGNHEFGWAWDRELTDENGPYVELMAGVFTDNQPDFSYLLPYETKTFSQYWWPYKRLGPVQQANRDAALRLVVRNDRVIELGLATSRAYEGLAVRLDYDGQTLLDTRVDVSPDDPWQSSDIRFEGDDESSLELVVTQADGARLIAYRPVDTRQKSRARAVATVPPSPKYTPSADELFFTGEHLELYRHPTCYPEQYWEEALRRDPGDARCNTAMGRRALSRGLFEQAAEHLQAAINRLTSRHPNPVTGEAHYYLGLTYRYMSRIDEAYAYFYKSAWNHEWKSAAHYELACIDARRGLYQEALRHLEAVLTVDGMHNKAHILRSVILRKHDRTAEALAELHRLLEIDPLDHWALCELSAARGNPLNLAPSSRNDAQTVLDVASDYADAGFYHDAIELIENHHANPVTPIAVPNPLQRTLLTHYSLAWLHHQFGDEAQSKKVLAQARDMSADYCFPSRLYEQVVLAWALSQPGADRNAAFGLGNYCYDKKRHDDAIGFWEQARAVDPGFPTAHRNLGIAYWNIRQDASLAKSAYQEALNCDDQDARLLVEYSQLCQKAGDSAADRLAFLESRGDLVMSRDDAAVELASLYNDTDKPERALELLTSRTFHPWEGGEGSVLRQYTRARILIGRQALQIGEAGQALTEFELALDTPDSLGEKYHLLQAKAEVYYWQGKTLAELGMHDEATQRFTLAAEVSGDFQSMAVTEYSEMSYYKGLALIELGRVPGAQQLFEAMKQYATSKKSQKVTIDYFATSLPNLLVFEEDLDAMQRDQMDRLITLSESGLALCISGSVSKAN